MSNKNQILKSQTQLFQGPLPPPEILSQYQKISPNFPERIMIMAEEEQKHRHDLEKRNADLIRYSQTNLINRSLNHELLGIILAFVLTMVLISASVLCAYFNQPIPASILGPSGIVGIAYIFIYGSKLQKRKGQKEAEPEKSEN